MHSQGAKLGVLVALNKATAVMERAAREAESVEAGGSLVGFASRTERAARAVEIALGVGVQRAHRRGESVALGRRDDRERSSRVALGDDDEREATASARRDRG